MKHLKKFNSQDILKNYSDDNWVSPHIYLDGSNKSLDYEEKYTPVEYIRSTQTGGQYIDLGCKLMENTDDIKIDIKFNIKGRGLNSDKAQSALICSQLENNGYPGFILRYQNSNSDRYLQLQAKWNFTNSYMANNKYTSKYLM